MLPLPDSLLERSFYSQLEINSPNSSSNQAPPPPDNNFPFIYPSPTFFFENFHPPPPPLPPPPINTHTDTPNLDSINQPNPNTTLTTNSNTKRVARKDRHSKINTAAGLRDRRMRLSLDVARKFFDLQDVLGFDKASKTVQWLLTKSKTAIKEITGGGGASSKSTNSGDWPESDCEEGSTVSDYKQKAAVSGEEDKKESSKGKKVSGKVGRKLKGNNVHHHHHQAAVVDKETRAKARERARERTKEKNRLRWITIASSIAVESSGEGSCSSVHRQKKDAVTEEQSQPQPYDRFTVGDGPTGVVPMYDYNAGHDQFEGNNYGNFSLYQGQYWGMEGLQFNGMQYHSRPW